MRGEEALTAGSPARASRKSTTGELKCAFPSQATDLRDHIFSLCGIAKDWDDSLRIGYNMSKDNVFACAVIVIIRKSINRWEINNKAFDITEICRNWSAL